MQLPRMNRRNVLRGVLGSAAICVALPQLESLGGGLRSARAQAGPGRSKFGVWFFGNGVRLEHWTPSATGAGWQAKSQLAALATPELKPYVSVISGLNAYGNSYVHAGPASAVLTGTGLDHADGDSGTPQGPSIDVQLAPLLGETPFSHLETGLYNFLGNGSAYHAISHNGPDAPNMAEQDARSLYGRLFGDGSPGKARADAATGIVDVTLGRRASVLDAVLSDCADVNRVVSAADRLRIEQHCESIRALERRLSDTTAGVSCVLPEYPDHITDDMAGYALYGTSVHFREVNRTMSQLLAYALACDLTHVFTHCFTNPASHWQIEPDLLGINAARESFHVYTHDDTGDQPTVHAGVMWQMSCLADTLEVFRTTQVGDGNLLDNISLMVTSDCSVGQNHNPEDMPFLLIGKGGGLRGDYHYRGSGQSVTQATFTAAHAASGGALQSFGTGDQAVTARIDELFA